MKNIPNYDWYQFLLDPAKKAKKEITEGGEKSKKSFLILLVVSIFYDSIGPSLLILNMAPIEF